ncbi:putative: similar to cytoplasmic dynein intermediate chain [Ectocarpus siliculosus]|uniref:Putative: similar to cytoplasmic dynein intermediate chain n=1 Tax=Ectocarpus siliculosus TaxID=2880 RepID=D7FML5_ECTSI|nr:putative: similar to cytoplasmic dynein intermediate chain [Ectocarpus siliculosus]|eukprot:CBJ25912.1 putative: similar to cytoplasmic dynein intermediate chain [Ectocarpus siliculosus]
MADADAVRQQRQKQLEDKRRRLDALRKRKKEKETATKIASDAAATAQKQADGEAENAAPGSPVATGGADLDAYIKSLLSTPAPGGGAEEDGRSPPPAPGVSTSTGGSSWAGSDRRAADRLSSLTIVCGLGSVDVAPKSTEFYDKGCQADLGGAAGTGAQGTAGADEGVDAVGAQSSSSAKRTPDKRRNHRRVFGRGGKGVPVPDGSEGEDLGYPPSGAPSLVAASSPSRPGVRQPVASTPGSRSGRWTGDGTGGMTALPMTPPATAAKPLSVDEKKEIVQTDHFQDFLRRSSRVLERALGEKEALDVLLDYAGDEGDSGRGDQGQRLNEAMTLHEDRWCQERSLTDLQWSPHHPELVLASYTARGHGLDATSSSALHTDADGLVLVWSMAMQHRPEYQLSSQSPVLTARFHPFDTHVIIGGTYSGQVVVWDTRAKSLPVQRTPLSATGHTYPVYNLHIGGTDNAPSLLTASTEGRVSTWNPSQLSQPLQDINLTHAGKPVTISSMAVAQGDEQKNIVVGSESGGIYTTPLHFRNSGVVEEYSGHYGLVTSVDANPSASKPLRGLVLSSSVDWTTRLWRLGQGSNACVQTLTHGTYDYVCDAKWSPKHPALFVTANISGELGLWNLNHSMEEPFTPPVKVVDRCALTRMAWSPDGRRLCVGDAKGYARVFNMDQETALPRTDEDLRLEAALAVKANGTIP